MAISMACTLSICSRCCRRLRRRQQLAAKAAAEGKPGGDDKAKAPAPAQVRLCLWQMLLGMIVKGFTVI